MEKLVNRDPKIAREFARGLSRALVVPVALAVPAAIVSYSETYAQSQGADSICRAHINVQKYDEINHRYVDLPNQPQGVTIPCQGESTIVIERGSTRLQAAPTPGKTRIELSEQDLRLLGSLAAIPVSMMIISLIYALPFGRDN